MIRVIYSELDGPEGLTLRLEASGHAGYAPAGQDIVCAGASTLMQALVSLLAGEKTARSDAWDEPEGPRLAVTAAAPQEPWVEGAFELAKAGFALLAERYPDNLRFADLSRQAVAALHSRWAAEEAALRQVMPEFSLKAELQHPEMRRLMQLPGMRMADAYRLAHYEDALRQTAHAVEQGVVERIRQRAARPAENGTRPGSAAVTGADVSRMTRAQREALERKALHGEVITF